MADQKISQLTPALPLAGTEELPAVQGGANVKVTADQVKAFANDGLGTAAYQDITEFATAAQGALAATALQPGGNSTFAAIGYVIDGGGAAITTGLLPNSLRLPFACTINSVTLLADQTGSIVVDIWKDTYANYPPVVADSICGSAKPTLSAAAKSEDTTLTGWTTSIAAGDVLLFNVDSAATVQNVTIVLKVTKT